MVIENCSNFSLSPEVDFIYNRFDYIYPSNFTLFKVQVNDTVYEIPVHYDTEAAQIGLWLSPAPPESVDEVVKTIFAGNSNIKTITYQNYLHNAGCQRGASIERNHWSIQFPKTPDELDARLSSKKRYNIKREKRLAKDQIGDYTIIEYSADTVPGDVIEQYFDFKHNGYGIDYHMSAAEYLDQFHVSNVYVLCFSEAKRIGAIICSCEQGQNVYLENLTYDPYYKKYSLGSILYDEYLKILIKKQKRSLYLGYGQQIYKSMYGAHEAITFSGTIYRTKMLFLLVEWLPRQKKHMVRIVKNSIKKMDVLNLRNKIR